MKPQGTTEMAAGIDLTRARPFSPVLMSAVRGVLHYYPVALIFVLWEICSRLGLLDPIFVPPLSAVLATLYEELFVTHDLLVHMGYSFARAGIGFSLAATVALRWAS